MALPVSPLGDVDSIPGDVGALLDQLVDRDPAIGLALIRALGGAETPALRGFASRLDAALEHDAWLDSEVDAIVSQAASAQEAFENWTDDRIDLLLFDLADAFAACAGELAAIIVDETGLGNVVDKAAMIRFASRGVYDSLAGKSAQGLLSWDPDRRVRELASPVGVIFATVPVANPAAVAIFKALIAIKSRNALILSFHHEVFSAGQTVGGVIRRVLEAHSAPPYLVQWASRKGSRKKTRKFMRHPKVSLVIATGSDDLVSAAYSSGTPAIGVGGGNAPAWICADADLARAARAIVASKSFDNGLTCGAEHHLVVDARVAVAFVEALTRQGAAVLSPKEREQFTRAAFVPDGQWGALERSLIGQSADDVARATGISRPYIVKLLVIEVGRADISGPYGREKLAPFLSMFVVSGEDEGLMLCRALLKEAGSGQSAVIHTTNAARVERFARTMPASRILVNSPAAQGSCGLTTGLDSSMTLSCGTFGGNSTTDNLTYRHLLNIKRVAHHLE